MGVKIFYAEWAIFIGRGLRRHGLISATETYGDFAYFRQWADKSSGADMHSYPIISIYLD